MKATIVSVDILIHRIFALMWLVTALVCIIVTNSIWIYWWKQRSLYYSSNLKEGAAPTLQVYIAIYGFCGFAGLFNLLNAPWILINYYRYKDEYPDLYLQGFCEIGSGLAMILPILWM